MRSQPWPSYSPQTKSFNCLKIRNRLNISITLIIFSFNFTHGKLSSDTDYGLVLKESSVTMSYSEKESCRLEIREGRPLVSAQSTLFPIVVDAGWNLYAFPLSNFTWFEKFLYWFKICNWFKQLKCYPLHNFMVIFYRQEKWWTCFLLINTELYR